MTVVIVTEAVAIVLLGLLVLGLLRSHADILRRLHDLGGAAAGGPAPLPFGVQPGVALPRDDAAHATAAHDIAGRTPAGDATAITVAGAPVDTLLAFLSSGCHSCAGFWSALGGELSLPPETRVVAVTYDVDRESESALRSLAPAGIPVVMSSAAWQAYGVPHSPYFIYVDGRRGQVVGEGAATTWAQVANLFGQARADSLPAGTGNGAHREARADRELLAAGIHPGHPSLFPTTPPGSTRPA